jgi:hypothetical protein
MASISDFTRHFENRRKYIASFAYTNDFYFLHMSFRINLDTPPEHSFCSDDFSLGARLYRRPWSLQAQNIACRYGLARRLRLFAAPHGHWNWRGPRLHGMACREEQIELNCSGSCAEVYALCPRAVHGAPRRRASEHNPVAASL